MKKQNLLATGILIGFVAFLYMAIPVVSSLNEWSEWDQPAIAAKFMWAIFWGLVAFCCAIGIDIKPFLGQFIPALRSPETVSDEKRSELAEN